MKHNPDAVVLEIYIHVRKYKIMCFLANFKASNTLMRLPYSIFIYYSIKIDLYMRRPLSILKVEWFLWNYMYSSNKSQ